MPNQQPNVPIYDNVHGFITLTDAEHEIINSIYFQRLREIKQLSFAYFVFAGAVHTRFSHSLGVLAIVTKLLQHLERNRRAQDPAVSDDDSKILRMAALLHDIGHYPLSHLVESVYQELHDDLRFQFEAMDEAGVDLDPEVELILKSDPALAKEVGKVKGHHETLGNYIINNTDFEGGITSILLSHEFTDDQIIEIGLIICGSSTTNWYNQVLHSELDADRLDYLLRDSHAAGVHYGNFDFDYLLNNCRLVLNPSGNKIFCVKASALFTVEHYLLARYFWYAQIICERKIVIFDQMGKEVYKHLVSSGSAYNYTQILQAVKNPLEFFQFNDNYYWQRVYSLVNAKASGADPFYAEIAEMLLARKSYKRLRIPTIKQLCHHSPCPLDCDRQPDCDHRIKSSQSDFELYESTMQNLFDEFAAQGIDTRYAIKIKKNVFISKRFSTLEIEEQERDPVRILESPNGEIKLLNKMGHSVISHLSNYELFLPRIYVHEKHREFAQHIVNPV